MVPETKFKKRCRCLEFFRFHVGSRDLLEDAPLQQLTKFDAIRSRFIIHRNGLLPTVLPVFATRLIIDNDIDNKEGGTAQMEMETKCGHRLVSTKRLATVSV